MEHDYAELDDRYKQAAFKQERLELAKSLGYSYISECTIDLYRKYKSCRKVGKILKISQTTVANQLKLYGEPIRKRGSFPGEIRKRVSEEKHFSAKQWK